MATVYDRTARRYVDVSWRALTTLVDLARRAGAIILACREGTYEAKPDGSPVTAADRAAQAFICAELRAQDETIPIVAEEMELPDHDTRRTWHRYWLVDPLDGTKEFLAGLPEFTVNIALIEDGEPVLGVIGAPALQTVYAAARSLGTWRYVGDHPATRLIARPADPPVGLRIVESRSHPSPELEAFVDQFAVVERMRMGSALKFCRLAEGQADCYPRFGPTMAWDVAAGDCLFRNAAPGLTPHPSPFRYCPVALRNDAFVIGFGAWPSHVTRDDAPDATGPFAAATLDDDVAQQETAAAGLVTHSVSPLICESPLADLHRGGVTPNASFYVRNHFSIPHLTSDAFCLLVGGLVERSLRLRLSDLREMPSRTRAATLECAGNGRSLLTPQVSGEHWNFGAVGTAEWTGVPLAYVLELAHARAGSREVVFRGADSGRVADVAAPIAFERSLTLTHAREGDILLAYEMNGTPLPRAHGYPLRLVVPGWYGMAWVKWLVEIDLIAEPFAGHYQAERYWYESEREGRIVREPVTVQRVRALITDPSPGQVVRPGPLVIRGVAWSGAAPLAAVDVRVDEGPWQAARFTSAASPGVWQLWEVECDVSTGDTVTLCARATDRSGHVQAGGEWNRRGYGNNARHGITVRIDER